jgi:putative MATE family efflux protein
MSEQPTEKPPEQAPGSDPSVDLPGDIVEDPEVSPQNASGTLAAAAAFVSEPFDRAARPGVIELLRLSWPVMLSQVLITSVALADIAMVGRLGSHAVAAVGYATQFFFMTQSALFAVGFACVALMARAIGAGDPARARASLGASLWVGVATAALVCGAALIAPRTILGWLSAEPAVIELTVPYMRLVLSSSLLLAVSLVLENGLRADKDTFTPMLVAWIVAAVKLCMSGLLIFGYAGMPRLELVGAGVATVISQLVGLVAFVTVIARQPATSPVAVRLRDLVTGLPLLGTVMRVAAPGVAERLVLNLALLSYFAILGGYGTVAVAAYTLGVRAISFSWIPGTGFAAAVATLVGQALGRGDEEGATVIGRRAVAIALWTAIVLGAATVWLREPIAHALTTDPATIAVLTPLLLSIAIAQPMLQTHFTLAGIFRGAGNNWTPLVSVTVGNWGVRVPLAILCAKVLHTDIVWVWAVLVVDHVTRMIWLGVGFRNGTWKRRGPPRSFLRASA